MILKWEDMGKSEQALLGALHDGVWFYLTHHPTCYRRGPYKLYVDICYGSNHYKWGCFDEQDQPVRWYHSTDNAKSEAEAIASVLLADRLKHDRLSDIK